MKPYVKTILICFTALLGVSVLAGAYKYKFRAQETISVTGLAATDFTSDQIVWSGNYSRKMMDLKMAYAQLKEDEQSIRTYLLEKGVQESELIFSAVGIEKEYNTRYNSEGRNLGTDFTGYKLMQSVTVDSRNIDKVEKISREITELIQRGIEFNSTQPSYYYSKLSELKIDLLAKASADAKERAQTIATNAGSDLGKIKKATMGVFQITGQNSNEDYSYGGAFNTSSRNKTASITIRVDFAVD
jgi:hypothetical protein